MLWRRASERRQASTGDNVEPDVTPGARVWPVSDFALLRLLLHPWKEGGVSHDLCVGAGRAFRRIEITAFDLDGATPDRAPKRLTNNEAQEDESAGPTTISTSFSTSPSVRWKEVQGLARASVLGSTRTAAKLDAATDFDGSVMGLRDSIREGSVVFRSLDASGVYAEARPDAKVEQLSGWPGTYGRVAHAPRLIPHRVRPIPRCKRPDEVYLADSAERLGDARPNYHVQQSFTEARTAPRKALPLEVERWHAPWKAC